MVCTLKPLLLLVILSGRYVHCMPTADSTKTAVSVKADKSSSDVYEIRESPGSTVLVNPKPIKPTLREIIYYHIIERPYGSENVSVEGSDERGPEMDESRRPFTNSHGFPFLNKDNEIQDEEIAFDVANAVTDQETTEIVEYEIIYDESEEDLLNNNTAAEYSIATELSTQDPVAVTTLESITSTSETTPVTEVAMTSTETEPLEKHTRKLLFDRVKEKYFNKNIEKNNTSEEVAVRTKRSPLVEIPEAPTLGELDIDSLPPFLQSMFRAQMPETLVAQPRIEGKPRQKHGLPQDKNEKPLDGLLNSDEFWSWLAEWTSMYKELLDTDEFWSWLAEWTSMYKELLDTLMKQQIKEQVTQQIAEAERKRNLANDKPVINVNKKAKTLHSDKNKENSGESEDSSDESKENSDDNEYDSDKSEDNSDDNEDDFDKSEENSDESKENSDKSKENSDESEDSADNSDKSDENSEELIKNVLKPIIKDDKLPIDGRETPVALVGTMAPQFEAIKEKVELTNAKIEKDPEELKLINVEAEELYGNAIGSGQVINMFFMYPDKGENFLADKLSKVDHNNDNYNKNKDLDNNFVENNKKIETVTDVSAITIKPSESLAITTLKTTTKLQTPFNVDGNTSTLSTIITNESSKDFTTHSIESITEAIKDIENESVSSTRVVPNSSESSTPLSEDITTKRIDISSTIDEKGTSEKTELSTEHGG